jgi:hypothetical protein
MGGQWGQTPRANNPLRPVTFACSFREICETSLCRQRQTEYRPSRSVLQGDLEMDDWLVLLNRTNGRTITTAFLLRHSVKQ